MGILNHHSKERILKLKEEGYKPSEVSEVEKVSVPRNFF
jgi:hypothetical protein